MGLILAEPGKCTRLVLIWVTRWRIRGGELHLLRERGCCFACHTDKRRFQEVSAVMFRIFRRRLPGFTIVELVVVILLVGVLSAIALPRFLDVTDDARDASAIAGLGGFASAIQQLNGEWLVKGRPASIELNGIVTPFSDTGYPQPAQLNNAGCVDLWESVHLNATPIDAFVAGAAPPGWSTLRFGTGCLFVYQFNTAFSAANPLPFFIYLSTGNQFSLLTFNWPD